MEDISNSVSARHVNTKRHIQLQRRESERERNAYSNTNCCLLRAESHFSQLLPAKSNPQYTQSHPIILLLNSSGSNGRAQIKNAAVLVCPWV